MIKTIQTKLLTSADGQIVSGAKCFGCAQQVKWDIGIPKCNCEHAEKYNALKLEVSKAEKALEFANQELSNMTNLPLSAEAKEYLYQEGLKELELRYRT